MVGASGSWRRDSALRGDSFELLLYRAVRRSAPVAISVALHLGAALVALHLTPAADAPGLRGSNLTLTSVVPVLVEAEEGSADEAAPGVPTPREAREEPVELQVAERESLPGEADAPADAPAAPRSVDLSGLVSAGGRRRVPAPNPAPRFDGNPAFDGEGADDANMRAASLVRKGLGGGASGDAAILARLDPRRIHVCEGCYDHVERILALLGVRHDTLTSGEIGVAPLEPDGLLIVDCGTEALDEAAAKSVREFVESGGYLCTTDWGLEKVLVPAFPGVVRPLRRGLHAVATADMVVPFRLAAKDHPLARGLVTASDGGAWWLENQAHPVEVLDARRATVLAESPELEELYGSGVLAVTFPWGKGKVLHLLGHAWQKEGNLKGTYGIQRLLLNFLLDRAGTATVPPRAAVAAPGR